MSTTLSIENPLKWADSSSDDNNNLGSGQARRPRRCPEVSATPS